VVSQGHMHVFRVTCEGDEPSSSQQVGDSRERKGMQEMKRGKR
jgi:hypothetical protein